MWPFCPHLGRQDGRGKGRMTAGLCSALFMLLPCSHPMFYMGFDRCHSVEKSGLEFSIFELMTWETCMGAVQRNFNLGPTAPFTCSGFVALKWLGRAKVGGGGLTTLGGGVIRCGVGGCHPKRGYERGGFSYGNITKKKSGGGGVHPLRRVF